MYPKKYEKKYETVLIKNSKGQQISLALRGFSKAALIPVTQNSIGQREFKIEMSDDEIKELDKEDRCHY